MKNHLLVTFLLAASTVASAQPISAADKRLLARKEDSLKVMAKAFLTAAETGDRMRQDSLFVKTLIRSLQVKHSFEYGFDSVRGVSHLYAPDSTFRIFTWQLGFDNDYMYNRQRGAIQFRTPDGSLKLVPLKDYSEFADDPADSARNRNTWIGAVYYNIIKTEHNGKAYYTLFGFDGNSYRTNKKWIDVLTFDASGNPVFGGQRFFTFDQTPGKRKPQHRFFIEYKKEASTTLNYEPESQTIIVDHLVSETNEPEFAWTFVPDGDYEGFKWVAGRWQHVDKVYDFKLQDGEFPMPDALKDAEGNNNEQKLQLQNKKNTAVTPPVVPPKKPVRKG